MRIAIDDFGTGYSNLAYLRHLPVHTLKLAGTFVTGGHGRGFEGVDADVLAVIVQLAHVLGLSVTAESVETADQFTRLRRHRLRHRAGLALRPRPTPRPDPRAPANPTMDAAKPSPRPPTRPGSPAVKPAAHRLFKIRTW